MLNVVKLTTRLLNLSENICILWDKLSELSFKDLEDSDEFNECTKQVDDFLFQETILLNNTNKEILEEVLKQLCDLRRSDIAFERCYTTVDDYLEELYLKDDIDEDTKEDEDILEPEEDFEDSFVSEDDEEEDCKLYPLSYYYEDEEDNAIYRKQIFHQTAITAIRKMIIRLNEVTTDNKIDAKYKKKLKRYFKMFKYYFFSLDRDMEKMGVDVKFNVDEIKDIPKVSGDMMSIYYNECINLLDELFSMDSESREPGDISVTLFNMLCFDEYINKLDIIHLDKLINLCREFEKMVGKSFYGNIGKDKLIKCRRK